MTVLPLILLALATKGEYAIVDYIEPAKDCVFGECSCDISPAFDKTMKDCAANPPFHDKYNLVGCDFVLPSGCFRQSRTIVIDRSHRIRGAGGWAYPARTLINVKAGITAIKIAPTGVRAEIRDMGFVAVGTTTTTIPYFGIEMKARAAVDGVWGRGFVQGCRVDAGAMRDTDPSNSNGFWITRSTFDQNKHAGVYIDGADVNAAFVGLPSTPSNCQEASKWAPLLGGCGGFVDSSFLGNTIVEDAILASHSSANVERDGTIYPAYIIEGDNNHSICVGCYAERGQATSVVGRNAIAIGGIGAWGGLGLRVDGPWFSGAIFRNSKDSKNVVDFVVGNAAASGTFYELKSSIDVSRPLRAKAVPATRTALLFDLANQLKLMYFTQDGVIWMKPQ